MASAAKEQCELLKGEQAPPPPPPHPVVYAIYAIFGTATDELSSVYKSPARPGR
jgi:hypothetical protein